MAGFPRNCQHSRMGGSGRLHGGGGGYGGYMTEWGVHCGPPGRDCRDALEGRGRGAMRGFKSGSKGGYRRLEKRLGGSVWRVQSGWRAVGAGRSG